jgi:hypothetical protein
MRPKKIFMKMSKEEKKRTTALQNRIDTLYHRYSNYLITVPDILKWFIFC